MRKGSGLADWNTYAREYLRVTREYRWQYGAPPGRRTLVKLLKQQRLLSAAYHHHGGYAAVLRRLGFTKSMAPPRKRRAKRASTKGVWKRSPDNCRRALFSFTAWTDWGVMPPYPRVSRTHGGLAQFLRRTHHGWAGAAKWYQLLPFTLVHAPYRDALAAVEAFAYATKNGEWPRRAKCSPWLMHRRFRNGIDSWASWFARLDLPSPIRDRLVLIMRAAIKHAGSTHQSFVPEMVRSMNQVIIAAYKRQPYSRTPD